MSNLINNTPEIVKAKRVNNNFDNFKSKILLYSLCPILGLCFCITISCMFALFALGCYFIFLSYLFGNSLYKNYRKIKNKKIKRK